MNTDALSSQAKPQEPRHDTRRSGRLMRNVIVWLCSGTAAVIGFLAASSFYERKGDSVDKIEIFESSLAEYIHAAALSRYPSISEQEISRVVYGPNQVGLDEDLCAEKRQFWRSFNRLSDVNRLPAKLKIYEAVERYNATHRPDSVVPNSDVPAPMASTDAGDVHWIILNPSQILMKCLSNAAVSAVGGWIVAWCLLACVTFVWWFVLDRLREIACAVKGLPIPQSEAGRPLAPPTTALFTSAVGLGQRGALRESESTRTAEPEPERPIEPALAGGPNKVIACDDAARLHALSQEVAANANPEETKTTSKSRRLRREVRLLLTPQGRIGRGRWLLRCLVFGLFAAGAFELFWCTLGLLLLEVLPKEYWPAVSVCSLYLTVAFGFYLQLMNSIKRLHDFNFSGWWSLLFVPLSVVFGIGLLPMVLVPGTDGENRFGRPAT